MLLYSLHPSIQGAKEQALPSPGRQARVSSAAAPRHTQSLQASVSAGRINRRNVRGLLCAQAAALSQRSSALEADATGTNAIVLGASVGGLLSAAALSDSVDSVVVLDKDAFVSERLSHHELKQVIPELGHCNHALDAGAASLCSLNAPHSAVKGQSGKARSHSWDTRINADYCAQLGARYDLTWDACAAIPLSWGKVRGEHAAARACRNTSNSMACCPGVSIDSL